LIFRSFFAFIRNPLRTSRGEETSAAFGVASALIRLLRERKPDYLAFVLDTGKPTFRHEMFEAYKANRPEIPEGLREQYPRVLETVDALAVPRIEMEGFEADDLIGTLARKGASTGMEVEIYSGDKDFLQLVGDRIRVVVPTKEGDQVLADEEAVQERAGVAPERIIDLMALTGDSTDNIPGVPGVGPKTAVKLLGEHATLDALYEKAGEIGGKLGEKLRAHKKDALLSRELVTIRTDVPIDLPWKELAARKADLPKVTALFQELEFHRLLEEVAGGGEEAPEKKEYLLVSTQKELAGLAQILRGEKRFSVDTETTSTDPMRAELVGISFSTEPGRAWYVTVGHRGDRNIPREEVARTLGPLLKDEKIAKVAQNAKYDTIVLERAGLPVEGLRFDPMIASYLLDPGQRVHGLNHLALVHLNHKMIPIEKVLGSGRTQKTMDQIPPEEASEYACEDADYTLRLADRLEPALAESKLDELYRDVEIPLVGVLHRMEMAGVSVDTGFLEAMSRELTSEIEKKEKQIHETAGETFNVKSPKQLQEILFSRIGLKPVKKTKTGLSTDNDVLQELSRLHPLPALILEYRQLEKLRGTYVDALPKLIHPETGRIHTSFNQTVAATGRLSSSDPNLQNIPIRTEPGRKIRRAFVAAEGWFLLSLDYSQVELRLLAHLSGDERLIQDFRDGKDIHRRTAATLFGVEEEEVSGELRGRAKAVNFGIVYGMGAFGLASRLDIPRTEAQEFIDNYFTAYPGVKEFLEETVEEGRERGYVETMLHRRRYLPELNSKNGRLRSFAERTAVNTPIQGSAADLIKLAMIDIDRALLRRKLKARMILQVHDELVFEAPEEELRDVEKLARERMEGQMDLAVPLVVDAGRGKNWLDAHSPGDAT